LIYRPRLLKKEGYKKFPGMLNLLPYMVPVKRETQHLVAQKWYGYRVKQGF